MSDTRNQILATIAIFRDIATPLLNAVAETGGPHAGDPDRPEKTPENNAAIVSTLIETTGEIAKHLATELGAANASTDDWVRWKLAKVVADVVASYYRATAQPLPMDKAEEILPLLQTAAGTLDDFAPQTAPPPTAALQPIRAINHIIPVMSAIARFAFGRPEAEVTGEVCDKLRERTKTLASQFAFDEMPAELRPEFDDGILEAIGKLYAESHYAEMDRLLDMAPDERAKYVNAHNNKPPMDPVWEAFDLRIEMLTVLIKHIIIPDDSQMDPGDETSGSGGGGSGNRQLKMTNTGMG